MAIPNINGVKLYFYHKYGTELTFDGGTLETASLPTGPWTSVPNSSYEANGYPTDAIVPAANNPLLSLNGNNGSCFGGSSGNYITSVVNLDAFKNTNLYFRFRMVSDPLTGVNGWNVDNVYVVSNPIFVNNSVTVTSGATSKTGTSITLITGTTLVIPVTMTQLSAKAQADKTILVNWATATEFNSKGFQIERKEESEKTFVSVGFVASKNANGSAYQFLDQNVETGKLYYYRLRQVDFDGKETLSNIVSAKLDGKGAGIKYNNPVNNVLNLNLTNISDNESNISIYSVDGRLVHSVGVRSNDAQTIPINVSNWAKGLYIIKLNTNGTSIVNKLSVQ